MTYRVLLLLLAADLFPTQPISAQSTPSAVSLAVEFQAYPTGLIPGFRADYYFHSRHSVHLRAGYNWIRHGNKGVQNNEQGDGFGGTLGYRYFFHGGWSGWLAGARMDVWRNRIDWLDYAPGGGIQASGTSKILVWQPTVECGYQFQPGQGDWFITPSIAFGAEVNVKTEGVAVGEGAILLLGISAGKMF